MTATVAALFRRLEQSGIRYVILRNYEQLLGSPDAGASDPDWDQAAEQSTDVDLVIATEDVPRWRVLAVSLAQDFGWDALTECDHFTQSRRHEHDIEIFRFYRHSDQKFLQVDLFHSYLVWGLPFLTEGELLAGRVPDARRGLTRVDPLQENAFRLLQINGLTGSGRSERKIARYRDRVLRFDRARGKEFRQFLNGRFAGAADGLLDALAREDWVRYAQLMRMAKARFWLGFALRNPLRAARFLSARVLESGQRYYGRPCGRLVKVHAGTSAARRRLTAALDRLKRLNFIDHWLERAPGATLDRAALTVREQGGLLIGFTEAAKADLVIQDHEDERSIGLRLADLLIERHTPLFQRAGAAKQPEPAPPALAHV